MKDTKYYCDCCGKETEYIDMNYIKFYKKHKYDSDYDTRAKDSKDVCPECEKAIKQFMKTLKI